MQPALNDLEIRERNLTSFSNVTVAVTLVAVTMTFAAVIAIFLLRAATGGAWLHIQLPGLLWLSSAILIASSVVFEFGRRKLGLGDQHGFHTFTSCTIALALAFLLCQVAAGYQIVHSGIVLTNNTHSWFIFIFGGLHALHITAGLIGFTVLWTRTREQASGPRYQMGTRVGARAVAIFWHYMDWIWLVLFGLLTFWRR